MKRTIVPVLGSAVILLAPLGCSSSTPEPAASTSSAVDAPRFCPKDPVLRKDMARYLVRLRHGADFTPPPARGVFDDVPNPDDAAWAEQLLADGVTHGCVPGHSYCPNDPVPREQMAAFIVRLLHGDDENPSPIYTFTDLPTDPDYPFAGDIQKLAEDGITTGCVTHEDGTREFCPKDLVPREQMAAFLMRSVYGGDDGPGTGRFSDVPGDSQFAGREEQAVDYGIMEPCGGPGAPPSGPSPEDMYRAGLQQVSGAMKRGDGVLSQIVTELDEDSWPGLCDAFNAFAGAAPSYFFVGAHVEEASGPTVGGGAELAWDLSHEQLGAFAYWNSGATADVNLGGSIYAGYAIGGDGKSDIVDAWSGPNVGVAAEVQLPFKFVNASGFRWTTFDGSISGFGASIGVGAGISPAPWNLELSVSDYGPWDGALDVVSDVISQVGISAHRQGRYVQFDGGSHATRSIELAKSIFLVPVGDDALGLSVRAAFASYIVAHGVALDTGWHC